MGAYPSPALRHNAETEARAQLALVSVDGSQCLDMPVKPGEVVLLLYCPVRPDCLIPQPESRRRSRPKN